MLYNLIHCPHRVTLDLFGNETKKDPVSPFIQLLWEKGTMVDIGTPGLTSQASAINDRGQIVGRSGNPGSSRAFLWEDGTMIDLGPPGVEYSWAHGINNRGQIAGLSYTQSGEVHAFLWIDGSMTDLGTLGGPSSYAFGINSRGQVMGRSSVDPESSNWHAFLWNP